MQNPFANICTLRFSNFLVPDNINFSFASSIFFAYCFFKLTYIGTCSHSSQHTTDVTEQENHSDDKVQTKCIKDKYSVFIS